MNVKSDTLCIHECDLKRKRTILYIPIYQFLQNDIEFLSDSLFHALKLETTKNASKKISCCCQLDLCARNVDISVVTWAAGNATAKGLETTRETRVLSACGDPAGRSRYVNG